MNTVTMMIAAAVMTRALLPTPARTAPWVSRPSACAWKIWLMRNTSQSVDMPNSTANMISGT